MVKALKRRSTTLWLQATFVISTKACFALYATLVNSEFSVNIGFWLKDRYVQEWADNCMFCLYIVNVVLSWAEVKSLMTNEKYVNKVKYFLSHMHRKAR